MPFPQQDGESHLTSCSPFVIQCLMKKTDEHILRSTKEIIVKFIEMGRLSPSNVNQSFQEIYSAIHQTVTAHTVSPETESKEAANESDNE